METPYFLLSVYSAREFWKRNNSVQKSNLKRKKREMDSVAEKLWWLLMFFAMSACTQETVDFSVFIKTKLVAYCTYLNDWIDQPKKISEMGNSISVLCSAWGGKEWRRWLIDSSIINHHQSSSYHDEKLTTECSALGNRRRWNARINKTPEMSERVSRAKRLPRDSCGFGSDLFSLRY